MVGQDLGCLIKCFVDLGIQRGIGKCDLKLSLGWDLGITNVSIAA